MSGRQKQLIYAILIAVVAVVANKFYIESRVDEFRPKKIVKLIRAKKAIQAGDTLRKKEIESVRVPAQFAPRVAIRAKEADAYLGQDVTVDIPRGDYILENYFSVRRAVGKRLSDQVVGENMRAITLPVGQTDSLAGSILTGDRIDLIWTFNAPGLSEKFSMALLQSVPVIATGSYSVVEQELGSKRGRPKKYSTLTLLLPVHDAMRLNFARKSGKIDILLRNSSETLPIDIQPISGVIDLLSAEQKTLIETIKQGKQMSDEEKERLKKQLRGLFEAQKRAGKRG